MKMPVGKHKEMQPIEDIRTPQQLKRILEIIALPEFAFACGNPMHSDKLLPGQRYKCTFNFLWYDIDDKLRLTRITPTGRIARELTA